MKGVPEKFWASIIFEIRFEMKKLTAILFLFVTTGSCILSKYKRTNFTYNDDSVSYSIPIVVPKGFTKERTEIDSMGNTILSYSYGDKTLFYVAHLQDTATRLQPIIEEQHIPHVALSTGALVYKGVDADNQYWREIRRKDLRVGYRSVPRELESRFDSATNYAILQKFK